MFVVQPILTLVHFIRDTCHYFFLLTWQLGRGLFMFLTHLYTFFRGLVAALIIIGEELYRFFCELEANITAFIYHVNTSANNGILFCLESCTQFYNHISSFCTNTGVLSRQLVTGTGRSIGNFFTLIQSAIILIGDCVWWMLMLLPRLVVWLLQSVVDGLIFNIYATGNLIVRVAYGFLEDFFRLAIGLFVLLILLCYWRAFCRFIFRNMYSLKLMVRKILINCKRRIVSQILSVCGQIRPEKRTVTVPLPNQCQNACVICRDNPKCVLLLPCKHLCMCESCASQFQFEFSTHRFCPLCREQILEYISVYT